MKQDRSEPCQIGFPAAKCCRAPPPLPALPVRAALAATPSSASSMSGRATITATTRRMPQGAAALKKMAGVKVVEEENVPETDAVEKTMESMINLDGARLLFPTSFGYFDPHILKIAGEISEGPVRALRRAVDRARTRRTSAAISATSTRRSIINGIVAGYATKSGKLGFVAAKPIPQVLRNINAFTLGARLVNPNATTQVIFTGDWSMPVKEAEATNSLIDQGVDVITCMSTARRWWCRPPRARRHGLRLSLQPGDARAARPISPAPNGTGPTSIRNS